MTCPNCAPDCAVDDECDCRCHEVEEDKQAYVIENQVIEYEVDTHMPEGTLLSRTRIHVTGPSAEAAYIQFKRVLAEAKQ